MQCLPPGRVQFFFIGVSAKAQAARSQCFEKLKRVLMAATITNMHPVGRERAAQRALDQPVHGAWLGATFGDDGQARKKHLGIFLTVPVGYCTLDATDMPIVVDIP